MDDVIKTLLHNLTLDNAANVALMVLFVRGAWKAIDFADAVGQIILAKVANGMAQQADNSDD